MPHHYFYLEHSEQAEATHKFYEVVVNNDQLTVRFGRIDTTGQTQVKEYDSTEEALAEAQRKVAEKLRKGYTLATPRTPASTLGRLDIWLRRHRPVYYARLIPGLDDQQLRSFEAALGLALPDGLRDFFRWRNGQALNCYAALVHRFGLMEARSVVDERRGLNELLENGELEHANWWSSGWVPFLENGFGDFYCVDFDGTFTGRVGQVLHYCHDYEARSVIAPDFDAWLKTVVSRLEADDVVIDGNRVDIEDSPDGYPQRYEAG
jgi:predicted DNA-binding WGR domain protein